MTFEELYDTDWKAAGELEMLLTIYGVSDKCRDDFCDEYGEEYLALGAEAESPEKHSWASERAYYFNQSHMDAESVFVKAFQRLSATAKTYLEEQLDDIAYVVEQLSSERDDVRLPFVIDNQEGGGVLLVNDWEFFGAAFAAAKWKKIEELAEEADAIKADFEELPEEGVEETEERLKVSVEDTQRQLIEIAFADYLNELPMLPYEVWLDYSLGSYYKYFTWMDGDADEVEWGTDMFGSTNGARFESSEVLCDALIQDIPFLYSGTIEEVFGDYELFRLPTYEEIYKAFEKTSTFGRLFDDYPYAIVSNFVELYSAEVMEDTEDLLCYAQRKSGMRIWELVMESEGQTHDEIAEDVALRLADWLEGRPHVRREVMYAGEGVLASALRMYKKHFKHDYDKQYYDERKNDLTPKAQRQAAAKAGRSKASSGAQPKAAKATNKQKRKYSWRDAWDTAMGKGGGSK